MNSEKMDFMIQEITMNMPKEATTLINNAEESAMWDKLEIEIAEIKAKGHIVDMVFDIPTVDPIHPTRIVESEK